MGKCRILIQGAMNIENDSLISAMRREKEETIDGFKFVTGRVEDLEVIVSKTYVGMVNATLATHIGISNYQPSLVINQGTAGAHDERLTIGDIVVGKRFINYGAYRVDERAKGEGYSIKNRKLKVDLYNGTEWVSVPQIDADLELVEMALGIPNPFGNVISGTIATGDGFNKEYDAIVEMNKVYQSTCEDMEAFASAQVCQHYGIPFLGVRVISNNELTGKTFDRLSCDISQTFCLSMLKKLACC